MPTSKAKSPQRPTPIRSKADVDLDALEREVDKKPFTAKLGGEVFTFADPTDTDWRDARAVDPTDLDAMMRALLGDQFEAFEKHPLPVWKLAHLANQIQQHYGLTPEDLGESSASPTS